MDNKKVAVDFADWLLDRDVTRHEAAMLPDVKGKTYRPQEYELLRGELKVHGDELFDEFLKDKKDKLVSVLYEKMYEEIDKMVNKEYKSINKENE